jgi:hypothetical protein
MLCLQISQLVAVMFPPKVPQFTLTHDSMLFIAVLNPINVPATNAIPITIITNTMSNTLILAPKRLFISSSARLVAVILVVLFS